MPITGTELDVHNMQWFLRCGGINDQYSKEEIRRRRSASLRAAEITKRPYQMRLAFETRSAEDCAVRSLEGNMGDRTKVNLDHVGLTLDVFNEYLYCGLNDIDDIKCSIEKSILFSISTMRRCCRLMNLT